MNKKEYIKAVDNITAPDTLLEKIEALDAPSKKKMPVWKTVTAVAACFVAVIIAFSGIVGGSLKAGDEGIYVEENGFSSGILFHSQISSCSHQYLCFPFGAQE